METSLEMVRYNYSQDELVDLGSELVRHLSAKNAAEDQFESIRADHKNVLAKIEADVNSVRQRVAVKYEMRNIRCLLLKFRPNNDSLLLVRLDNGRILKRRKMNADERQITISDQPPELLEYEVDLCEDTDYAVVLEDVQLTAKEAKELGAVEGLVIRAMAKKLEAGREPTV